MSGEESTILGMVKKHIDRVLPQGWHKGVTDPRNSRNKKWSFGYALEVLMAGALTGCKTL
jgi:hypothetical protein